MKRILTSLMLIVLTACQPFQIPGGTTAPPAAATSTPPQLTPGGTPEPPAGAVFEIPAEWKEPKLCAVVTASEALNLRAEPSEKGSHIAYLLNGQQVKVNNPAGRWWNVTTRDGQTGYANSRYLQAEKCQ